MPEPPRPDAPGPAGHRVQPVRRARRLDQHHAADLQSPGLRGHPPRAQPLGAGGRRRRDRGGRPGRRGVVLPGRPRRVLRVPRRVAARARAPATCKRRRRWRRRHRATTRSSGCAQSGVTIFSPEDGQRMGLAGDDQLGRRRLRLRPVGPAARSPADEVVSRRPARRRPRDHRRRGRPPRRRVAARPLRPRGRQRHVPVLGITGTGGSGKSRLTDELVRRFRVDQQDKLRVAVIAVDPTRRKRRRRAARRPDPDELPRRRPRLLPLAGHPRRATRCPTTSADVIDVLKAAGFDLVIVETPGIGQGDAGIVPFVDDSLYVMTPEFGAASPAREDRHARLRRRRRDQQVRAPRRQGRAARRRPPAGPQPRARSASSPRTCRSSAPAPRPSTTTASPRSTSTCAPCSPAPGWRSTTGTLAHVDVRHSSGIAPGRAADRVRYLSEITETVRGYHARTEPAGRGGPHTCSACSRRRPAGRRRRAAAWPRCSSRRARPSRTRSSTQLERWPAVVEAYSGDEQVVVVRDREIHTKLTRESL